MDYRIKEFIRIMEMLDKQAHSVPLAKTDPAAIKEGLRTSRTVTREPENVNPTPIMKNLLVCFGDLKQTQDQNGEWKTERLAPGKKTRAVEWVNEVVNAALLHYNGPEKHDYPTDLPISDRQYLNVDCWNGWKPEIWDIQPGQTEEAGKGAITYKDPKTNISVVEVINLIKRDPSLQASIISLLNDLPEVQASEEIEAISDPFMSKGTGVSYPDFRNDRTPVPGTGYTYARYEIKLAKEAKSKGMRVFLQFAYDNNVYTLYIRRQRGKGRPLIAQSRRTNLVINCINGPEMEQWKKKPQLRAPFVSEDELLEHLAYLGDWVLSHADSTAVNLDYSKWDRNLGAGWIAFQNAARYLKAKDEYTRQLVICRHVCNARGILIDGIHSKVYPIYGRMTSGYDDTTLGNSTANRGMARAGMCHSNKQHISQYTLPLEGRDLTVVGDDLLLVGKKGFQRSFIDYINKTCKAVIHEDEKHAEGLMFIQYRCIKNKEGKWIITYNWPRVLRSMLSKEDAKHLGRGGWTFSFYQQLGKLRQDPDSLRIVLNIVAACDQYHLSLNTPVKEINEWVKSEDAARVKEGVASRESKMKRKNTTAERLYNSNPNIPGVVQKPDGSVELDIGYFSKLQAELRAVYDPNFLVKLGFANPDLSKVH